jgi:DNA-3-methyladenine glycosylase I
MIEIKRCFPSKPDPLYEKYHDQEWGKLNLDEKYLFEMLTLESFQSGLSWATILHKRENFQQAFANWNYEQVAKFEHDEFAQLMQNAGIVRNRRKIEATINNAQAPVNLHAKNKSLKQLCLPAVPEPIVKHPTYLADLPSADSHSKNLARLLKKSGFRFVGPVTCYSFLEAVGLINDHADWCDFKYLSFLNASTVLYISK